MEIFYSEVALKELKKITKGNKRMGKRIVTMVEKYAKSPSSSKNVKVLKGNYGEFKRLRIGDYRVS